MTVRKFSTPLVFFFALFSIVNGTACTTKPVDHGESVLVLGGTRNTGFETVKLLLDDGYDVTVMVRATSDLTNLNTTTASTIEGDAFDLESLQNVFAQKRYDAVISTLGAKPVNGQFVGGIGNINAMNAASEAGVTRFVLTSSLGVSDSRSTIMGKFDITTMKPFLEAKERAEDRLKQGDFDYTIIRPGGLVDGPATGKGMLKEEAEYGQVSRGELARHLVAVLRDDATIRRTYHLNDRPFMGRSR